MPASAPADGGAGARWAFAGLMGGAAAGAVDGVLARAGILRTAEMFWLVCACALVVGLAGLTAGSLVALAVRLGAGRRAPVLLTVALAPLVVWDATSAFAGRAARRLPAHQALAVGLAAAGLAAVFGAALALRRVLAAVDEGRLNPTRRRALVALMGGAWAGVELANHTLLLRLYPWFHATLALLAAALAVLVARVALAGRARTPWFVGVAVLLGLATLGGRGVLEVRRTQSLRFAISDKTQLPSLALRLLPGPPAGGGGAPARAGPAPAAQPALPEGPHLPAADVVLITVDALRADHVGAYGYRRPTTPALDALAARGVRFDRAYAQAPHTSFSVASMLTGKYFATLARVAPGERHETLPDILRRFGWRTAAFFPPSVFFIDGDKLKAYQDGHFGFEYVKFEYLDAAARIDQIVSYFESEKPQRAFVWVHFFEPHEPYEQHAGHVFGGGDIDRYDSEIAFTDAAIGRLVGWLGRNRPGAVVIVGADHGEEFDEHGGRYHGSALYEEQIRIPLLVAGRGIAAGVVAGPVQLVDVAPTILNLIDVPVPVRMRGTDLGPWLASPPAPAARLPPAFSEVEDKRAVVQGTDKLLCDMKAGACALYDLAADPRETRNLADAAPARAAALRATLDAWLGEHSRYEPLLLAGGAAGVGGAVPKAIERGRVHDVGAVPGLLALLAAGEAAPTRREAARLLASLPPQPSALATLAAAAADADAEVAGWASVAAARGGDASAIARARTLASGDGPTSDLRLEAALALAGRGDGAGVPVLAAALGGTLEFLRRREIVEALGRLGDRRALPALVRNLDDVLSRRVTVEALGRLGDPSAVPALVERLRHDAYVDVRAAAAAALGPLGDRRALPALETAAKTDETRVAAAARAALEGLRASARP